MAELDKLTMLKADLNMLNPPPERVAMLEQLLEAAASRLHSGASPWRTRRETPSFRWSMRPGCTGGAPFRPGLKSRSSCGWT